jgi:AcrR family transcriptional regulator
MISENPATAKPAGTQSGKPRSARERIFETARELFYRHGIRAVGVETIAAEAGATKMSLYRHFPSKDELVAECLRDQDREFWKWWDSIMAPHRGDPRKQIEALFHAFQRKACEKGSRGCPLANAAVELPEDDRPAKQVVLEHNAEIRRRLRDLCREMKAREPAKLGDALMLLLSGSYLSRLVFTNSGPVTSVAEAARILVQSEELGAPAD